MELEEDHFVGDVYILDNGGDGGGVGGGAHSGGGMPSSETIDLDRLAAAANADRRVDLEVPPLAYEAIQTLPRTHDVEVVPSGVIVDREKQRVNGRLVKEAVGKKRYLGLPEQQARSGAKNRVTLETFFHSSRNNLSLALLPSCCAGERTTVDDADDTVVLAVTPPRANPAVQLVSLTDKKGKRPMESKKNPTDSSGGSTAAKPPLEVLSEEDLEDDLNDDIDSECEKLPPPRKRQSREYDRNRRFHSEWSARFPWAEGVIEAGIHFVKCIICSKIDGRPKLLAAKLNTLIKHEGHRKAKKDQALKGTKKGDGFIAKECRHQKNAKLFAKRPPETILQQVNHVNARMRRKKTIQFASIFQVLANGRPMLEYEEREGLYNFLNFLDIPRMHWTDSSGWCMAEAMYEVLKDNIRAAVKGAEFIALTCDEVIAIDNTAWLSVHADVIKSFQRLPLLLKVQKMTAGTRADDLVEVLMDILKERGGLEKADVEKKLISFGADGAAVFQGKLTGVTTQLREKNAPFVQSIALHISATWHSRHLASCPLWR